MWLAAGRLLVARELWFVEKRPTNNTAEIAALVVYMEWLGALSVNQQQLDALGVENGAHLGRVRVMGDSKLVIDFCRRNSRPSKPELFIGFCRV